MCGRGGGGGGGFRHALEPSYISTIKALPWTSYISTIKILACIGAFKHFNNQEREGGNENAEIGESWTEGGEGSADLEHALEPSNMSTTKSGRAAVKTLKLESRVVERGMHWSPNTFQQSREERRGGGGGAGVQACIGVFKHFNNNQEQEVKTLKLESRVVERRAVDGG